MTTDAERLDVVEYSLQRVWEILNRDQELASRVGGLRADVQVLQSFIEQDAQNRRELRVVGDGLRSVRETATATKRTAARRIGALSVVVLLGIFGTVVTGWWAHTARLAATEVLLVARQQCADRDAGLREAVARETSLAGTDVPAAREAHRRSATVYAGQIRDCDRVYPIPGR